MKQSNRLMRVDFQASILTAVVVLFSSLSIFMICYYITYNDMIASLNERVMSIYEYLDENLNKDTFDNISLKSDIDRFCYKEMKDMLEQMKKTTGVMYLYTAKANKDDELIYVVDGLESSASDFRYPGDYIEPEIQGDLRRALSGEVVMPKNIKTTEWGKIFITYMPIHSRDNSEIIGVIGIEFKAEHQYDTYKMLLIITPLICILFCLVTVIISGYIFRRISNPHYKDLSNTDGSTKLKNRNSFDVDMENLQAKKYYKDIGILVADLNYLKKVNDMLGHTAGDRYIQLAARIISENTKHNMVTYRIGGDEFAVIIKDSEAEEIENCIKKIHTGMEKNNDWIGFAVSLAVGYAVFDEKIDMDLRSTFQRADANMYAHKRMTREHKMIIQSMEESI